jgi:hypothetical protein
MTSLKMINNLVLNPLQREIIDRLLTTPDNYIAVRAGWGSGKTSALVFAILAWAVVNPNTSSLLITDTSLRYKQVLGPEMDKWLTQLGWYYVANEGKWIFPPTNHTVWVRAYFRPGTRDSSHNPLEGLNVTSGLAVIDECQTMPEEVANKALGRLRSGPKPKIIMCGLPLWDCWWTELAKRANCEIITAGSKVNAANLSSDWFEATKNLSEAERLAMVEGIPQAPSGLIYNEFNPVTHVVRGWEYNQEFSSRIAIDFGFRKPSVLILTHDPALNADVISAEINPQEIKLSDLAKQILDVACPRELAWKYPGRILLDGASGDKAGAARNDQTALSAFRALKNSPEDGGIGMSFRWCTDPVKTDVMNGIMRVKALLDEKRILVRDTVWEQGLNCKGNSIRKAILSYAWDGKEAPKKDGQEDPLDALRYDILNWNWRDNSLTPAGGKSSVKPQINNYNPGPKTNRF